MAGFGLPNFGQLTEAFRKAQQIQQDAQKLQEELDLMKLEGRNSNKQVSVWMTGNQKPIGIEIDESLLKESKANVEEALLEAFQNAHELSTTTMKERMEELTGGLNISLPGFNAED